MIMDNPGPAIFEADPADEYRLTFSIPDRDEPGGRRALMTMRCFEEDKLRGAIVWLGEHQHLWPTWQAVAEAEGGNALSARLVAMTRLDSLRRFGSTQYLYEECLGASVARSGGTEIELSVTLTTRSVPIITHAFKNERLRNAFMDYIMSEHRTVGSVELAELALLKGRNALARKLDSIARSRSSFSRRAYH